MPDGTLKTVTVMFCDLVGSTRIIAGFSPERVMKLYSTATAAMGRAVVGAGGTVVDRLGDGLLAVFGAPIAQPDHALRACQAGLGIRKEISSAFADDSSFMEHQPKVRVGLNSAEVAVTVRRDGRRVVCRLYGDEVNLASRVESAAEPDSVYITQSTFALLNGKCEAVDVGIRELDGFAKPVRLYKLLSVRSAGTLELTSPSPLVGRDDELAVLARLIEQARSGTGRVCVVFGEPGVGKTRLVEELRPLAIGAQMRWVQGHSPPFSERLSYWPIIEALRALVGIDGNLRTPGTWEELLACLRTLLGDDGDDLCPYVALLLGVALPTLATDRLPASGSEAMSQQMLRALWRLFAGIVHDRPIVLVIDDLQWADASSIEVLKHIVPIASEAPLVVIGIARPDADKLEFARHVHRSHPNLYVEIPLQPLPAIEAERLLKELMPLGETALSLRDVILGRADGNPFFVEEIVRALKQSDTVFWNSDAQRWFSRIAVDKVQIPNSIQATVLARVDRLDDELRETLRIASVIGREFSHRLLHAITDPGFELDRQLNELTSLELIDHASRGPELEFKFKHAVVQETVYGSVFEERRRQIHLRVAECLKNLFGSDLDPHFGVLAFHFIRAEKWEEAQQYLLYAADQAQRLAADSEALAYFEQALQTAEKGGVAKLGLLDRVRIERKLGHIHYLRNDTEHAIAHFRHALRLLGDRDPSTSVGVRARIAVEIARHIAYRAIHRFLPKPGSKPVPEADVERRIVYERMGWCHYHGDQERMLLALLLAVNLAELRGDVDALAIGCAGIAYFFNLVGVFGFARNYHLRALDFATRSGRAGTAALALNSMGLHLWYLGQWDAALDRYNEGIRCATEAADGYNWMSIHAQQALLFFLRGELRRSFDIGRHMVEVARESAIEPGVHWGLLIQGRALFHAGRRTEGLAILREAIARATRMPDYQCLGQAQGTLTICLLDEGNSEEAFEVVSEAVAMARAQKLLGHDAMDMFVALARVEVERVQRAGQGAGSRTAAAARGACKVALRRGRVFSGGLAPVLRIAARLEWLRGNRSKAEKLWADSRAAAERVGARSELAGTLIEQGTLAGDNVALSEGQTLRAELVARHMELSDLQPLLPV